MGLYLDFRKEVVTKQHYVNMLVGSRRIGKTFGAKDFVFIESVKKKHLFVWIRRYPKELDKDELGNMFNELSKQSNFKYDVSKITYKQTKTCGRFYFNNKYIGMSLALSQALNKKSVVNGNYSYFIFDEFLLMKGSPQKYLPNEPKLFLELIGSFVSLGYEPKMIIMLANKMSFNNPYFNFFNIPIFEGRYYKHPFRDLFIINVDGSEEFKDAMNQTKYGQFIQGTDYGNYFIENESLQDNTAYILPKFKGNIVCNFFFKNQKIGLYSNDENLYISNSFSDNVKTYFITRTDNTINTLSMLSNRYLVEALRDSYRKGRVFYQDLKIKSLSHEMFDILNIL